MFLSSGRSSTGAILRGLTGSLFDQFHVADSISHLPFLHIACVLAMRTTADQVDRLQAQHGIGMLIHGLGKGLRHAPIRPGARVGQMLAQYKGLNFGNNPRPNIRIYVERMLFYNGLNCFGRKYHRSYAIQIATDLL